MRVGGTSTGGKIASLRKQLFLQNLFSPVANAREPLLCLKYTLAIVAIDEEKYAIAASIICVGHFDPDFVRNDSVALRHGLVVRIAGSHPAGPGSIPGGGKYLFLCFPHYASP